MKCLQEVLVVDYVFENIMELVVKNQVEDMMERSNQCHCDKCKMDVMALVLNKIPPKYVATNKGALITRVQSYSRQGTADLTAAITAAMETVRNFPLHEG